MTHEAPRAVTASAIHPGNVWQCKVVFVTCSPYSCYFTSMAMNSRTAPYCAGNA